MVCSEYELGISEDHDGIILLDADAPVGTSAAKTRWAMPSSTVDVLSNMARGVGLLGVAREVAALTGQSI